MTTRVCVAVESTGPTVGSAAGRAVNVNTLVAEVVAVASVAAGVEVPAPGAWVSADHPARRS